MKRLLLIVLPLFLIVGCSKEPINIDKLTDVDGIYYDRDTGERYSGQVFGFDMGKDIPTIGVISVFLSLLAVTFATLWQKKLSNNLPLSVSNMYQAIGGCLFNILLVITIGKPFIIFSITFITAMSHQIFLISFGAFTILMYLIKNNSASKTVTLFFLVPPTSAFMAFIFLNENLNYIDILGFLIVSIGVFIATRVKK